ncbi:DUF555 domain-containing protein [Halomicroarcula sp. GCM10025710]
MNKHATHAEDWYQVRLTLPWVVPGAPGVQDAINIAVAEVGRRADASAVHSADISVQDVACPSCGWEMEAVLCTHGYAMVVLDITVEIEASSVDESTTLVKRELGSRMKDIPLTVLDSIAVDDIEDSSVSFAARSSSRESSGGYRPFEFQKHHQIWEITRHCLGNVSKRLKTVNIRL